MRSLILVVLASLLALLSAIPITPSAPRLQKRAEQFRLQGLREFEIAERLSASPSETATFRSRLNHKLSALFHSDYDLAGDIAPGSLDSPSMLPRVSESSKSRFAALLRGGEEELGYEGKEGEMRRPVGSRHWAKSFGGFRRFQG